MNISDDALLPRRLWSELVQWRGGYQCEDCERDRRALEMAGYSGRLNAHHLDGDDTNNRLANGCCVCPACHGKRHVRGSQPCEPGCECGRHTPKEGAGTGNKPCAVGCTCKKHDHQPAIPFTGGSDACPPGCTCGRHDARFLGQRRSERPCERCGRTAFRASPGLCQACQMADWRKRTKACA